jgi:negative regulator of flagellin synthesis FlgM
MKIGNPADKRTVPTPVEATTTTGTSKSAGEAALPKAGAVDPSAKVQLSNAATLMGSADSAEFDADKVARISQAISDGSFKINAEVIADRLIANAQELLGKVQR